MRAAKAAKDLQEVCGYLGNALEEAVPEFNGESAEYLSHNLLPVMKLICAEICTVRPENPAAHIAVWLLERCFAPDSLKNEAYAWVSRGDHIINPSVHLRKPVGEPPKNRGPRKQNFADEVEDSSTPTGKNPQEDDRKSDNFKIDRESSRSPPSRNGSDGSPKSESRASKKMVHIWKSNDGGETDREDEMSKDEKDEEDSCLEMGASFFAGRNRSKRGSVVKTNIADRRRRFTQVLYNMEVPAPPEEEILDLLRPVKVLQGLSEAELKDVAGKVKCRIYQADENIITYNTQNDDLHVIVNGIGAVYVPHQVGAMRRGDVFGNQSLMPTNSPSTQQISAFSAPVTTLSLSSVDFEHLHVKNHFIERCTQQRIARNFANFEENTSAARMSQRLSVARAAAKDGNFKLVAGYTQSPEDRQMIKNAVKCNKVLGDVLSLLESQYDMIADYMRLIEVAKDEAVIKKGERGDALYIVHEGFLDCTIDADLEGEFRIRTGDAFGELGLLYDAPRSATIVAACDCRLWVLHRYEFQIVMSMTYCAKAAEYSDMLSKVPYLSSLIDPTDMDMVAGVVEELCLLETEELCVEGEDEGCMFIVFEGTCDVVKDGEVVRSLKKGDWVGEEQLKGSIPAIETVKVASQAAVVLALDKQTLKMAIDAIKEVAAKGGKRRSRAFSTRGSIDAQEMNKYTDHMAKKKVTNSLLQKRVRRALAKYKHLHGEDHKEEFDLKKQVLVGGLGEGSFGCVYLVKDPNNGKPAAVKAISKEQIIRENMGTMIQNERKIMMLLDSEFVVRLYSAYQDLHNIYLVLEPVVGGELFEIYDKHNLYGQLTISRFHTGCITLGLEHMHKMRVIYRDLKLENCLLDQRGYLKLTDMGIAKVVIGKSYTVCGTADYFAPETLKQLGHNRAVDWWALGVLVFIMCSGRSPFDAPQVQQIYKNIIKGFSKVRFPENFPSDLIDVIKSLCRTKPEERVTMQKGGVENLKEMPFFSKFDWAALAERKMEPPWVPEFCDLEASAKVKLSRQLDLESDELDTWDGYMHVVKSESGEPASENASK